MHEDQRSRPGSPFVPIAGRATGRMLFSAIVTLLGIAAATPAVAAQPAGRLRDRLQQEGGLSGLLGPGGLLPGGGQSAVGIEAVIGEPFGVGHIELQLDDASLPEPLGPEGIGLHAAGRRVFYPAIDSPQLGAMIKGVLNQSTRPAIRALGQVLNQVAPTRRVSVYFLFRGADPLALTLELRTPQNLAVQPVNDPAAHGQLLQAWWRTYTARRQQLLQTDDYPPLLENYLQTMLSRRLGLQPPEPRPSPFGDDPLDGELAMLLDTEAIRGKMVRARMLQGAIDDTAAAEPLPPSVPIAPYEWPPAPDNVALEPLARHVPAECLYVRFGNFTNFLWFQDTLARWGGDLRNLLAQRGLDHEMSRRMQQQLMLHQTVLARLLGEAVVADAAIIGTDSFLGEGAAIGLLFQARAPGLLGNDIRRQRQEALGKVAGLQEHKAKLADREISELVAPDGSVRSYYVSDGQFHFVTTSKRLAHRFLEVAAAEGAGSLAEAPDFRAARVQMPLDRQDTVWIYMSDAHLRNMVGPQYRIETRRRLEAVADIELLMLARLAAATEGQPAGSIEELIAGGFLPPGFGQRPDGSRTVMEGGKIYDSLRGMRGSFVPIPDVPVTHITPAEAERYAHFSKNFQERLGRLEPMFVGLKRTPIGDGRQEQVAIDFQMSPMSRQHYDFFREKLGAPDNLRLRRVPGDIIEFEAILTNQRLFGGFRDRTPPEGAAPPGLLSSVALLPLGQLRNLLVGYLGYAGGPPGLLEFFDRRMSPPDAAGISRSPLDIWRQKLGPLTVYSLHYDVLTAVTPQLKWEDAPQPAQVRFFIGDLSAAPIAPLVDRLAYERNRQTDLGNLRLLHAMSQQLRVPGEAARDAAELVLDARLVSPLGGDYVFRPGPGPSGSWTTTSRAAGGPAQPFLGEVPPGVQPPPLNWFRGIEGEVLLTETKLAGHADVRMVAPEPPKSAAP